MPSLKITKVLYGCNRCKENITLNTDIDPDFWGCPRGSCDAHVVGEVITKIIIKPKPNYPILTEEYVAMGGFNH